MKEGDKKGMGAGDALFNTMEGVSETERERGDDELRVTEGDGPEEEESFAEMLAASRTESRLRPGQKVEAVIVTITPDWVFLDIGGKSEGHLDRRELLDAEGNLTVKEGDTIRAYFLSSKQNEKLFTAKIGPGEAARSYLEDAWHSGIPVEGQVDKEVKGGFEIRIAGNLRGFCPFSQTGLMRTGDVTEFIGKRLPFKIIEYKERGRNIILSRRAILEEEQQKLRDVLKLTLQEGTTVKGTVTSVQDFGAFVDIGGIQGLLPISEIGWGRVEDIREHLAAGQELEVAVVKLDWEKNRITLSLKENLPDPWEQVDMKFLAGSLHTGKVTRLTKFGAFVTLEDGVDGLIHISKLASGKKLNHPGEVLNQGQTVSVRVEKVEREKRRIALALAGQEDEEDSDRMKGDGDYQKYLPKTPKSFGSFGDILESKRRRKKA
jgi:small subunit ribosomal protein S1